MLKRRSDELSIGERFVVGIWVRSLPVNQPEMGDGIQDCSPEKSMNECFFAS